VSREMPSHHLAPPGAPSRRTVLKGVLAGAGVLAFPQVLAACGNNSDNAGGGGASNEVEVFSWWTGGGEAAGLDAMTKIWNQQHPNVKFTNAAVAGGAGSNAKAVLAQRLAANEPPDSFQGHAGAELSDYIRAGQVEPLNSQFDEWGLRSVYPKQLLDQITIDGNVYSVPVNIHRANVLWHSPAVLSAAGVSAAPTTMDGFFDALDKVKATGKTPLTLAEQWTQQHLLETVMLANLGPDEWAKLWKAGGDWGQQKVTTSLEQFVRLLGYANTNAASLTWQDAAKQVVDGQAGFNVMGDWADGYFLELKKTPKTDYAWAPSPGTAGVYDWLSDSFTLPKGAKHRDAALDWLKLSGSKEGQDAFNPVKGSISPRSDTDVSKYGMYLQDALKDFKSNTLAGSLSHGVVANNAWSTDISGALGTFLQDKNVAQFQTALANAAKTNAAA
jgi:glucose/mannose transport system substrate-binding protein